MKETARARFSSAFSMLVDWPGEAAQDGDYRLGVLGDCPILGQLETLAGREVLGRRLGVRHFRDLEELEGL